MVFADGSHLETDMIVFSAGIRPRDERRVMPFTAGPSRGGVAIDNACRTSDHNVYAIGGMRLLERADLTGSTRL